MTDSSPSVSVVVATYQRGARLAEVLGELLANVDPAEVVVVDDGSTDETAEVLKRMALEHPRLRAMSQPNAGEWLARLAGARVAVGEIVLMLDDDVVPDPEVVPGHAAHHAREAALVVVGYMPVPPAPPTSRSWARDLYALTYEQHCRAWEAYPETVLHSLWAGHMSIRRDDLLALSDRIAGGPQGYHRDLDLGLCAAEAGLRGRFDRRLGSRHLLERPPDGYAATASSSGMGLATIYARHGAVLGRPPVEPLPRAVVALMRRPRGNAAVQASLRAAVATLGALKLYRLQRFAAGRMWRVLQERAFTRRTRELRREGVLTGSGSSVAPVAPGAEPRARVAVIVPCFNDGVLALEAVDSIVEQEAVELVVVDDASTDADTAAALEHLRARGIAVVRHDVNGGLSAARRTGLAVTTAPFVLPLDSDDLLVAGVLARLADHLEANPEAVASYGDLQEFGTRSQRLTFPLALDAYRVAYRNDYPMSSLFRREALDAVGAWQDVGGMVGYEDWNLWMTLAEGGTVALHAGPDVLVTRRRLHGPRMLGDSVHRHRRLYAELRRTHPRLFMEIGEHRRRSTLSRPLRLVYPLLFGARPPFGLRTRWWALTARARRALRGDDLP